MIVASSAVALNSVIALSARNLHMKFGQRSIFDSIDLDIYSGQVTTLLGPNGAGKSTLLKLLNGETPSLFDINYFGQTKQQWQTNELAQHLGMLPQYSALTFPFLVHEVVELGGIPLQLPNKELAQIATEKMKLVDIYHLAKRSYPSLSGGEKQRVHLARVLTQLDRSQGKCIFMLDEPTSALDLAHQHNILQLTRRMAKEHHAAIVIVLHDLNLAAQYSDRLLVLHQGKIVSDGTPWQTLTTDMIKEVYQHSVMVIPHPSQTFPMIISSK